mmetsp:Transcript_34612/g.72987  ORF Transcript_34612/g.72987 Transcript_34612/m.72987 type:complete len:96 (-) Transcript_34612:442-729(-)
MVRFLVVTSLRFGRGRILRVVFYSDSVASSPSANKLRLLWMLSMEWHFVARAMTSPFFAKDAGDAKISAPDGYWLLFKAGSQLPMPHLLLIQIQN